MKYDEVREALLTQIALARREYFRLKSEIAALNPQLPQGCYISNYTSNYHWTYHFLGHKNAVLPSARNKEILTKKLHLGLDHNPNYRLALIEVELARTLALKLETLEGVTAHLNALKMRWRELRKNRITVLNFLKSDEGKQLADFASNVQKQSVFQFVVRQHLEF